MRPPDLAHMQHLRFLRRRYSTRVRHLSPLVEPSALVDVVLLLLIFFITSSEYVVRPGITLQLPAHAAPEGLPLHAAVVTVSQEGMVFFNDERITMEELPEAFRRARHENPEQTVVIEADESVAHKVIVGMLNDARQAGYPDVGLATRFTRTAVP